MLQHSARGTSPGLNWRGRTEGEAYAAPSSSLPHARKKPPQLRRRSRSEHCGRRRGARHSSDTLCTMKPELITS